VTDFIPITYDAFLTWWIAVAIGVIPLFFIMR
jgi:hypothetical protein